MSTRDFVEERRSKILGYINKNNRADVGELAEFLRVTEATIRRDLVTLDEQGLVERAHGGALRRDQASVWQISALRERMGARREEKLRIASFMTQLVHDGESLMIDGGSTTLLVAKELAAKKKLLVVTNSPDIGERIIESNDNKAMLTGGELLRETRALIGSAAEQSLQQYRTDKTVLGVSGMLVDEGCFAAIPQEAEIKRLMSLNSSETIIVCDSSKIGVRAFCFICDFTRVDKIVTDTGIPRKALEELKKQGVEVFTV